MENRWLTSAELIARWQAMPFEILDAHKRGLPFYEKSGQIITYPLNSENHKLQKLNSAQRRDLEKRLRELDGYLLDNIFIDYEPISDPWEQALGKNVEVAMFKLSDVEAYEQKHRICPGSDATIKKDKQQGRQNFISVPNGTTWRDVFIRVVTDERIEVECDDNNTLRTYQEFGLDRKKKLKKLLETLARDGFIKYDPDERENLSNLRQIFKDLFPNIKESPILIENQIWKPAFHISISE